VSTVEPSWDTSRRAFADAAGWFVATTGRVGDDWDGPGLGEWDLRALVGHTSRSLVTVETYLIRPADVVDVASTVGYYEATRTMTTGEAVTQRGRDAGTALGDDPVGAVTALADRVVALVDGLDGDRLLTTIVGGMRLADYLPTRTFELVVHTLDIAAARQLEVVVPGTAAEAAWRVLGGLAVTGDRVGPLLLAATGRTGLPPGFSVL